MVIKELGPKGQSRLTDEQYNKVRHLLSDGDGDPGTIIQSLVSGGGHASEFVNFVVEQVLGPDGMTLSQQDIKFLYRTRSTKTT